MQKGSALVILVILVLVLSGILVFVAWLPDPRVQKTTSTVTFPTQKPVAVTTPTASPSINDDAGLDSVSKSLDTTDLDSLDSELSKLDGDASF